MLKEEDLNFSKSYGHACFESCHVSSRYDPRYDIGRTATTQKHIDYTFGATSYKYWIKGEDKDYKLLQDVIDIFNQKNQWYKENDFVFSKAEFEKTKEIDFLESEIKTFIGDKIHPKELRATMKVAIRDKKIYVLSCSYSRD